MSDTTEMIEADLADQEAAETAGDTALANRLYRESMGVDAEVGPAPEDEGAAAESDIGPPPDGEWTFDRPEVVDHQFAIMESHFGDLATDLRSEWGADAGLNLQLAQAAAQQFEEHYPELDYTIRKHGARVRVRVRDTTYSRVAGKKRKRERKRENNNNNNNNINIDVSVVCRQCTRTKRAQCNVRE